MEPKTKFQYFLRDIWPIIILSVALLAIVFVFEVIIDDQITSRSLNEALIRLVVVIGLFVFIGNSGVISFGHIGFMMVGAYATAWQTMDPMSKSIFVPGLPEYLLNNSHHWFIATILGGLLAAIIAFIFGIAIMRLSGIAASIGTFAVMMALYSLYYNWTTWTAGQSSLVGIPVTTTPWVGLLFCILSIIGAFVYSSSRFGAAIRATREDEIAAQSAGINMNFQRIISFSISAFFVGMGGGLYAHFLGILVVDTFFLPLTFITLSMLVVGGMQSLSGAVVGTLLLSFLINFLRAFEKGVDVGIKLSLPANSAEIGLGLILLLILIFRPTGITRNQEIYWPWVSKVRNSSITKRQS